MLKKSLLILGAFGFAFAILSISVLESCSISYSFAASPASPTPEPVLENAIPEINYQLPYPGKILPGSVLWNVKALRDKVWYTVTFSSQKKAELALLFSDKRLAMSQALIAEGQTNEAISTLTKGEKYLETSMIEERVAAQKGDDTKELLGRIAVASLKHRQVLEKMVPDLPEQARPLVIKTEDYSKNSYKAAVERLKSTGSSAPEDPFNGD